MIIVSGHNNPEKPFNGEDNRIIREFSPHLPSLDETLELSSSSQTDPDQEHARKFNEERRQYVMRWFKADPETRAKMATEEEDGGRLIVRTNTYASSMGAFEQIAGVLVEDALQFEPPVEIDPHAIDVEHYAGQRYKSTYGFEVSLPSELGIVVPVDYGRVSQPEYTL